MIGTAALAHPFNTRAGCGASRNRARTDVENKK